LIIEIVFAIGVCAYISIKAKQELSKILLNNEETEHLIPEISIDEKENDDQDSEKTSYL